jgi:hypothetical protein
MGPAVTRTSLQIRMNFLVLLALLFITA